MRAATSPSWTRCGSRWSSPSSSPSSSSSSSSRWSSPSSSRSWSTTGKKWQDLGGLLKRLQGKRDATLPIYYYLPRYPGTYLGTQVLIHIPSYFNQSFRTFCNGTDYNKCDCGSAIGHPYLASLAEEEKQRRRRLLAQLDY